jgi:hypothetical protein
VGFPLGQAPYIHAVILTHTVILTYICMVPFWLKRGPCTSHPGNSFMGFKGHVGLCFADPFEEWLRRTTSRALSGRALWPRPLAAPLWPSRGGPRLRLGRASWPRQCRLRHRHTGRRQSDAVVVRAGAPYWSSSAYDVKPECACRRSLCPGSERGTLAPFWGGFAAGSPGSQWLSPVECHLSLV